MSRHPNFNLILNAMQDLSQPIWRWVPGVEEWHPIAFEVLAAHRTNPNPGEGPRIDIVVGGERPTGPPRAPTLPMFSPDLREYLNDIFFVAARSESGIRRFDTEPDDVFLERFLKGVSFTAGKKADEWFGRHHEEFLKVMSSPLAVNIARRSLHPDGGGLDFSTLEFVEALAYTFAHLRPGDENPYGVLHAECLRNSEKFTLWPRQR